jgi:cation transport regulator ChaB
MVVTWTVSTGGAMPKTTKKGDARQSELPDTLKRSPKKAQRTFAKAHDAAAEEYDDEERANRVAYAALKHSYEKVGDHWEGKESPGPSDEQAEGGRGSGRETAGGVDANASKAHLMEVARKLDVRGRSSMNKDELVEAIQKENDARSRRAREKGS